MKFLAQHNIGGSYSHEREFDTSSPNFIHDLGEFCSKSGAVAKDFLAFELIKKAAQTGKNFNEITVSVEVYLCIFFGDLYATENFSGACNTKITFRLEPAYPGLYVSRFAALNNEVANLAIAKYQEFFGF